MPAGPATVGDVVPRVGEVMCFHHVAVGIEEHVVNALSSDTVSLSLTGGPTFADLTDLLLVFLYT